MLVVGTASAFFAVPSNLLFLALAGGGGLLGVAIWAAVWVRSAR
jgi:hypothetical protein